mmetsp:Transcript_29512/g.33170  ORF Transcript_29512/g.33170 Transcript_29512/m.33170 type:complete len:132 (-) Transcript_29512:157-552(-)
MMICYWIGQQGTIICCAIVRSSWCVRSSVVSVGRRLGLLILLVVFFVLFNHFSPLLSSPLLFFLPFSSLLPGMLGYAYLLPWLPVTHQISSISGATSDPDPHIVHALIFIRKVSERPRRNSCSLFREEENS